jgi:hypothetical protein
MLTFILVVIAILVFTVVPVMIAARIVGAGRTGFWICFGAMIVSLLIVGFAAKVFHVGGLLGLFVAPLGYMWILETTYLRGLAMVFLQYVIAAAFAVLLAFTALGTALHLKDMFRHFETGPVQSV